MFFDAVESLEDMPQGNGTNPEPPDLWDAMRDMIFHTVYQVARSPKEPNYDLLSPNFGWAPLKTIKETFKSTTQYAIDLPDRVGMRLSLKSANPALNIPRRQEPIATDTVFSDTPAIDDGSICAQIFVGHHSLVIDVYGMKTDKEYVNTLEDNIRKR